jgi:hypothetical protein
LPHAVANDFAAAEFSFFAGSRLIFLNFDEQIRVGQPQSVTCGWSVEIGILAVWNFQAHIFVFRKVIRG